MNPSPVHWAEVSHVATAVAQGSVEAQIQSQAWEPTYATGVAIEKKKKKSNETKPWFRVLGFIPKNQRGASLESPLISTKQKQYVSSLIIFLVSLSMLIVALRLLPHLCEFGRK